MLRGNWAVIERPLIKHWVYSMFSLVQTSTIAPNMAFKGEGRERGKWKGQKVNNNNRRRDEQQMMPTPLQERFRRSGHRQSSLRDYPKGRPFCCMLVKLMPVKTRYSVMSSRIFFSIKETSSFQIPQSGQLYKYNTVASKVCTLRTSPSTSPFLRSISEALVACVQH